MSFYVISSFVPTLCPNVVSQHCVLTLRPDFASRFCVPTVPTPHNTTVICVPIVICVPTDICINSVISVESIKKDCYKSLARDLQVLTLFLIETAVSVSLLLALIFHLLYFYRLIMFNTLWNYPLGGRGLYI